MTVGILIFVYAFMTYMTGRRFVGSLAANHRARYSSPWDTEDMVMTWIVTMLCVAPYWPVTIIPTYLYAYRNTIPDGAKSFGSSLLMASDPEDKKRAKQEREKDKLIQALNEACQRRIDLLNMEHDAGVIDADEHRKSVAAAVKERDEKLPRETRRIGW